MDLTALRSFVAVAAARSFTKAAASLNLTQPALTRRIQKLESDLGTNLLVRSRRRVDLTERGALLLEGAGTILAAIEQTEAQLRSHTAVPSGTLTLGISPAAGQMLVPLLLERTASLYPKLRIRVVEGFTAYIHEGILDGRLDLGVLHDPEDRQHLHVVPLLTEPLLLVGPRSSPPRRRRRPSESDISLLANLPLVLPSRPNALRTYFEQIAAANGVRLNIRAEVDSLSITKALVQRGYGYTILSYEAVHQEVMQGDLKVTPVRHAAFSRRVVIARRLPAPESGVQRVIAKLVRDLAGELIEQRQWPGAKLAS